MKKIQRLHDSNSEVTNICILHTNDIHSYLDNFARIATLVKKIRKDNEQKYIDTILLDAGDVIAGSIYFMLYEGQKEAQLLNLLKYDAMTLGNHEFDRGSLILTNFLNLLKFPIIVSNINVNNDPYLKECIGNNELEDGKLFPFIIKELSNKDKIAILGLTTETTVDSASPSPETLFYDPIETAQIMVNKIRNLGINKIIILSHLGEDIDKELARSVDNIDVIIGGHSHSLLVDPILISNKKSQTIIVQAGEYGKYLGELNLSFDRRGSLVKINEKIHKITKDVDNDPEFKIIIDELKRIKRETSYSIIGETSVFLDGSREHIKTQETNLGDLVADSFFYEAKRLGYDPDMAIMNGGGIRSSIPKGQITLNDIINVVPFSKYLMILELTGKQIKEALEYGILPQVSKLKIAFDMKKDMGRRLIEILLQQNDKLIPIIDTKKYIVATNSFVGLGKDNFKGFKDSKVIESNLELDVKLLANYIGTLQQPIVYETSNRIIYNF